MSVRPRATPPKPWPLKWVVLAIVVSLALYTFITLSYRKPGPPYRPYQDAQDRATTTRLLAGGWSRIPVTLSRPVELAALPGGPAAVTRGGTGLGAEFDAAFAEKPPLLAAVGRVVAPAEITRGQEYRAHFRGTLADQHTQLGGVALYRRGHELVLIPTTERLPDQGLLSRWTETAYQLSFPTESLPPGRYQARLTAQGAAAAWSFSVR